MTKWLYWDEHNTYEELPTFQKITRLPKLKGAHIEKRERDWEQSTLFGEEIKKLRT